MFALLPLVSLIAIGQSAIPTELETLCAAEPLCTYFDGHAYVCDETSTDYGSHQDRCKCKFGVLNM